MSRGSSVRVGQVTDRQIALYKFLIRVLGLGQEYVCASRRIYNSANFILLSKYARFKFNMLANANFSRMLKARGQTRWYIFSKEKKLSSFVESELGAAT